MQSTRVVCAGSRPVLPSSASRSWASPLRAPQSAPCQASTASGWPMNISKCLQSSPWLRTFMTRSVASRCMRERAAASELTDSFGFVTGVSIRSCSTEPILPLVTRLHEDRSIMHTSYASACGRSTPAADVPDHARHPGQTSISACSSSTCLASLTTLMPLTAAGKSVKRRAAEALLASRYTSSTASDLAPHSQSVDRDVTCHAKRSRSHTAPTPVGGYAGARSISSSSSASSSGTESPQESTSAAGAAGAAEARPEPIVVAECSTACGFQEEASTSFCQFKVEVPHVQWHRVFTENPASIPVYRVAAGYQKWYFPEGVQVLMVENAAHLPDALATLKASMRDPVVAIDLEWRPQTASGRFSPVALIQLATSTTSLLIRTCRMQFKLHPDLLEFLSSAEVQVVGFSWASSDESKMQGTFQTGAEQVFGSFHDVQDIARKLGYPQIGLGRLTKLVLGLDMPKSRRVTMSNWEAGTLTQAQVKYAALDALVTGMLFRVLRMWHASSSPCAVCRQPLGALLPPHTFACPQCGADHYSSLQGLQQHARLENHAIYHDICGGCGRVRRGPTAQVPPPLRTPHQQPQWQQQQQQQQPKPA